MFLEYCLGISLVSVCLCRFTGNNDDDNDRYVFFVWCESVTVRLFVVKKGDVVCPRIMFYTVYICNSFSSDFEMQFVFPFFYVRHTVQFSFCG